MDLAGGGCLDLDDPTADFEFVPAMTPKGKGSRAAPAFAPSPVREEPEEEEEQEAMEKEEAMEEEEAMVLDCGHTRSSLLLLLRGA